MKLRAFSTLTDDILELGEGSDLEKLTNLGEAMATGHDNLVVFLEGRGLQKWEKNS